jgi:DNA polymerase-3 subunit epsilon
MPLIPHKEQFMADHTPVRQIVLDTETTGTEHKLGHRVIEIGCLEIIDRKLTGRSFHCYLNPVGATMDPGAQQVHGLTMEFLADKPQFSQKAQEFCDFIKGAEVLAHNSPFDEGFLNAELARVGKPSIWQIANKVTDTYPMAQSVFPGKKNGLDALCQRLEISNAHRTLHGALLDAELLAEVYLKMTENASPYIDDAEIAKIPRPPVVRVSGRAPGALFTPSPSDVSSHEAYLDDLEKINKKPPVARQSAPKAVAPR